MFAQLLLAVCQSDIRYVDLDQRPGIHVVVDREKGQYLGHPTTALLPDGKTILVVYPKGHGRGAIQFKRSSDGGLTWSERLPTPKSWATSLETPTIHLIDSHMLLWSGLFPARLSRSEDFGKTWSELEPVGNWGGIVVMGFVEKLRTGKYLAMFHDDGRFFQPAPQATGRFTLYKTLSADAGKTWSYPEPVYASSDMHLCEPGVIRSPDGRTLAVLLRENSRKFFSQVIFSSDEGKTWTLPRALPKVLTGDRHTAKYLPDGRIFVSYRDMEPEGRWKGDWVGWVGTWVDIVNGRDGQYKVRIKDNFDGSDCGYPGVEVLRDGTIVTTTYGHWEKGEEPFILCARFSDKDLRAASKAGAD